MKGATPSLAADQDLELNPLLATNGESEDDDDELELAAELDESRHLAPQPWSNYTPTRILIIVLESFLVAYVARVVLLHAQSHSLKPNRPLEIEYRNRLYRESFHLAPEHRFKETLNIIFEPREEHQVTVIGLHGMGDDERQLPFGQLVEEFPYLRWVIPLGRTMNIESFGREGAAWYRIPNFDNLQDGEDVHEIIESQRELHQLIHEERQLLEAQEKEPRIVLAGFSQGAVMSLLGVLSSTLPLEAAIMLSGYLPLQNETQVIAPYVLRDPEPPIFWGHGKDDLTIPFDYANKSVNILQSPPYSLRNIDFRGYEQLGHEWSEPEIDDLIQWFQAHIPRTREPRAFEMGAW